MKRSEINIVMKEALKAFEQHGWFLPPNPRWDITDFGMNDFLKYGLVLINLAEQPEYCEKLMYVKKDQITPMHYHASKKEDIICRYGMLVMKFLSNESIIKLQVNGEECDLSVDTPFILNSGERITLVPHVKHSFWAESDYAIVGEVSTANDDDHDNFFQDERIGRFSDIEEDEIPLIKLVSD